MKCSECQETAVKFVLNPRGNLVPLCFDCENIMQQALKTREYFQSESSGEWYFISTCNCDRPGCVKTKKIYATEPGRHLVKSLPEVALDVGEDEYYGQEDDLHEIRFVPYLDGYKYIRVPIDHCDHSDSEDC